MNATTNAIAHTALASENSVSGATVAPRAKTELVMQWNIVNGKLVSEWNFKPIN